MDEKFRAKVADFGLTSKQSAGKVMKGTPFWMAPEVLRGEGATTASDGAREERRARGPQRPLCFTVARRQTSERRDIVPSASGRSVLVRCDGLRGLEPQRSVSWPHNLRGASRVAASTK